MKYFQLLEDMSERMKWRWHIGEIYLPDGTEPLLTSCIELNHRGALNASVTHAGQVLEYCLTSFSVPLVTMALAMAIQKVASSDLQCIPVVISGQGEMMALNITREIRCINELHSEFDRWTERDQRPDKLGAIPLRQ